MRYCIDKQCLHSGKVLRDSEFSPNRYRRDGRSAYCHACCRRRQAEYRERLGVMKRKFKPKPVLIVERKPMALSLLEKVKGAISSGKLTRDAIQKSTKLSFDDVGEALAVLTFEARELRIVRVRGKREFHLPHLAA